MYRFCSTTGKNRAVILPFYEKPNIYHCMFADYHSSLIPRIGTPLVALLVHSCSDGNLQIPANALLFIAIFATGLGKSQPR